MRLLLTGVLALSVSAVAAPAALDRASQLVDSGIEIPPDLLAAIREPAANETDIALRLAALETGRFGRTTVQLRGSPIAGSQVSVVVEYVSPVPIPAGGIVMIRQHWADAGRLQNDSPQEPNYIKLDLVAGEPAPTLEGTYLGTGGIEGGLESLVAVPAFRVVGRELPIGSRLRFTIKRYVVPSTAGQLLQFPLHIQPTAAAPFYRVSGNAIRVQPAEFSAMNLSASSVAKPNEPIDLILRLEDQYGNLVVDQPMSLDLLVNGVFRERIEAITSVQEIPGISFASPGTYLFELRTGGGGISATSNPSMVARLPYEILWADLAVPGIHSDGTLTTEALVRQGLGLYDLVIPADHREHLIRKLPSIRGGVSVDYRWLPVGKGGGLLQLAQANGRRLDIALPEQPTDLRELRPGTFRLAQIVAGSSVYDWLGADAAGRGYPVGFVGSNHSHQYPTQARRVYTAIRVGDGEDWFDALAKGQTYVTAGSKMVLHQDSTNLAPDPVRKLRLKIVAGSKVTSIELFKNGTLLNARREPDDQGKRFRIELSSSSRPLGSVFSRPRNAREWVGYLSTRESTITTAEYTLPGWRIARSADSRRIDFLTRTHGIGKGLDIVLEEAGTDTVIEIGLAPGFEDAAWLPEDRLPAQIAAQKFVIPVGEALAGAERAFDVDGYTDTIRVEPSLAPLGLEVNYEFDDASRARTGDYYYYRVRLLDGSFAYTSPVFVGDIKNLM